MDKKYLDYLITLKDKDEIEKRLLSVEEFHETTNELYEKGFAINVVNNNNELIGYCVNANLLYYTKELVVSDNKESREYDTGLRRTNIICGKE